MRPSWRRASSCALVLLLSVAGPAFAADPPATPVPATPAPAGGLSSGSPNGTATSITAADDGTLWVVELVTNRLVHIRPR